MSFQPVLSSGGYAGWRLLQSTLASQTRAFNAAPAAQRDEAYVRERIGTIQTAQELIGDRRLLRVALTAFGLGEDLPNRAYIEKILQSATAEPDSFANRLTDKRYREMARAFGFGDGPVPRSQGAGFAEILIQRFQERSFEEAVGAQDEAMRLALALKRDLRGLAAQDSTEATKWFTVLGTPNLRAVFETTYLLPTSFGTLDIDRQAEILRHRTQRLTGSDSVSQFSDTATLDRLTQRFLLSGQIRDIQTQGAGNTALTLLQNGQASLSALLGR